MPHVVRAVDAPGCNERNITVCSKPASGRAFDLLEQLGVILGVRLVTAAQIQAKFGARTRAALPVFPGSGLRAHGTRGCSLTCRNPTRTRWRPACIPRSGGAHHCESPARCASILPWSLNIICVSVGLEINRTAFGARFQQGTGRACQVPAYAASAQHVSHLAVGLRRQASPTPGCRSGAHARKSPMDRNGIPRSRRVLLICMSHTMTGDRHWIQRTQAVGKLFRQHGDDAAREIHRIAAFSASLSSASPA